MIFYAASRSLSNPYRSIAVDHLYHLFVSKRNIGIAVVYCNYNKKGQQTTINLLAGIWRQLAHRNRTITNDAKRIFKTHQDRNTSLTLECSEADKTRPTLLKALLNLLPRANLMFTSRPLDSIRADLKGSTSLEVQAKTEDVAKYVRSRIATEVRLIRHTAKDPSLTEAIVSKVSTNAQKM
jgi:hypothetical protein